MGPAEVRRRRGWGFLVATGLIGLAVLLLLSRSVENSSQFSRWQPWILLLNLIGVLVLAVLLARKIWQLVRDWRDHVPGSRLTARTVLIFGPLVVVPLLVVYVFSLGFLNRGIDSWFRVEVKQGLGDALVLSRSALDLRMREQGRRLEEFALILADRSGAELPDLLDAERRATGASEIAVFGRRGEVLAMSSEGRESLLEVQLPPELLLQVRGNRPYSSLEPLDSGGYLISNAAPVPDVAGQRGRFVIARYGMPQQLAALTDAVQRAYSQYGELATLRDPLKYSFRVTLTVVLLLAMLSAIYLAIQSAHGLTRPVHDLIQGTRAVGKGDFATRLPLSSRDEMGFLVQSFNEMTKRLRRASDEAARSHALVEQERERLAVVLSSLSSGVLVVDTEMRISTVNAAADAILGAELTALAGQQLTQLPVGATPRLEAFARQLTRLLQETGGQWQGELSLPPDRVLRCACAPLAAAAGTPGFVVVFDDITSLLHAQRDAAWGEVARRLAHEIKNPLTPIQLAAERLNRRLHDRLPHEDANLLDRATHTIVQQVESLKGMVNAFSEYARAPELKHGRVDLNALVNEVAELYRSLQAGVSLKVDTDPRLEPLLADRGRLRQVLNNLLANAFEAVDGASDGWVAIATRLEQEAGGDVVVVTVSDNGHGFQKEMLARVFDPYVTSKSRGTGLGLAIVKKIADEHGGRVEADNGPEGGALVRVVLPVAAGVVTPRLQKDIA